MVDFGGLDNGKKVILGVIVLIGVFLISSAMGEESFDSWVNPLLGYGYYDYSYMSTTTYDYLSTTTYPITTTTYYYPSTTTYPITTTTYYYPSTTTYPMTTTTYNYYSTTSYPMTTTTYNYYSTTSYPMTTTTYNYYSTTSYPMTTTTYNYYSTTSYPMTTTTVYNPTSTTYVTTSPPSTTTTSNPVTTTTTLLGCDANGVFLYGQSPQCNGNCPVNQLCKVHPGGYPTCTCVQDPTVTTTTTLPSTSTTLSAQTCPVPITRSDIIVDFNAPNPKCNPRNLAKACTDNGLNPGDIVTARYTNDDGVVSTTPTPCPASSCDVPDSDPQCDLPPGCVLQGGTSLALAKKLQCYRDNKDTSWLLNCIDNMYPVLDWMPGPKGECTTLSGSTIDNIKDNCGITNVFPQYNTWTQKQKALCAADKIHQEIEVLNAAAGCKLYVCKHHAPCLTAVLGYTVTSEETGTHVPDPNGQFCGHAWNEYELTNGDTLIADPFNNIYYTCP